MVEAANRAITALFTALLALVLGVVLLCFAGTEFSCKRPFALPQWAMLLIGAAVLGGMTLLVRRGRECAPKRPWLAPCLAGLALLGVQLVLCFHAYFITGWDVRGITESAYAIAGGPCYPHAAYLSEYHNNIPIVLFFALIIRVLRFFLGNVGMDRCIYVLIALQCVLNTLTGLLAFFITQRMTGSRRFAWGVFAVYTALIGFSPWLMVPYTDSMALFFPTAVVAVYLLKPQGWGRLLKWLGLGLLAGVGYLVKPQAIIVWIAIALIELCRAIGTGNLRRGAVRLLAMALTLGVMAGPTKQLLIDITPANIRPHLAMNMLHYAMMGLSEKTNGIFDYDDVLISLSADNMEDRRRIQLEEIERRLSAMTAADMMEHLKKKTLTAYADGTFAWGCEGGFYNAQIEDKDDVLSPFLKSVIDIEHPRFQYLLTAMHSLWLAVLLGCALCGAQRLLDREAQGLDGWNVMMLALIGLMIFEWIFEVRARYLYLYAPYFVMLGVYGWWSVLAKFKAIKGRGRNP